MYEIKKVDLYRIKDLRKKQKITLQEMSKILGYKSPNGYYYIEKGRIKMSAEALAQIANILKVPIDYLFLDNIPEMAKRDDY